MLVYTIQTYLHTTTQYVVENDFTLCTCPTKLVAISDVDPDPDPALGPLNSTLKINPWLPLSSKPDLDLDLK